MRVMRRVGLAVGVFGLSLSVLMSPLTASADTGARLHGRVVPAHKIDGLTPTGLLAQLWTRLYSTPFGAVPDCFTLGETGKVVVNWTENACPVHRGQVAFVAWGSACDDTTAEEQFFAVGVKAQRRCTMGLDRKFIRGLSLSLDGATPVSYRGSRFEFVTRQFTVFPVEDSAAGGAAGVETHALAHAWIAFIEDLPPGAHRFVSTTSFLGGGEFSYTRTVTVVR